MRIRADLGERDAPRRAESLEERELRLDRDGMGGDGVDDPAAEAGDVAAKLDGKHVGDRIEPDHELAPFTLDRGSQTVAEMGPRAVHRLSIALHNDGGPRPRGPPSSARSGGC